MKSCTGYNRFNMNFSRLQSKLQQQFDIKQPKRNHPTLTQWPWTTHSNLSTPTNVYNLVTPHTPEGNNSWVSLFNLYTTNTSRVTWNILKTLKWHWESWEVYFWGRRRRLLVVGCISKKRSLPSVRLGEKQSEIQTLAFLWLFYSLIVPDIVQRGNKRCGAKQDN